MFSIAVGFFWLSSLGTLLVIPGDKADQTFNLFETILLALGIEMSITCCFRMNTGTAQVFHRDVFT